MRYHWGRQEADAHFKGQVNQKKEVGVREERGEVAERSEDEEEEPLAVLGGGAF